VVHEVKPKLEELEEFFGHLKEHLDFLFRQVSSYGSQEDRERVEVC